MSLVQLQKQENKPLGLLPQTVKCTTSSPLTPLHPVGVAKLAEADGLKPVKRLAKQPA